MYELQICQFIKRYLFHSQITASNYILIKYITTVVSDKFGLAMTHLLLASCCYIYCSQKVLCSIVFQGEAHPSVHEISTQG